MSLQQQTHERELCSEQAIDPTGRAAISSRLALPRVQPRHGPGLMLEACGASLLVPRAAGDPSIECLSRLVESKAFSSIRLAG